MNTSDWIAASSLAISLVALFVAFYGIRRANKTTSAATMVTLNEGFRQAWERFISADGERRIYQFAELLNLFEIACASYLEASMTGNSRALCKDYLESILRILVKNEESKQMVTGELLQSKDTFIFIRTYLKERKPKVLSVTVPPEWYQ